MDVPLKRQENGNLELTLTVSWPDILVGYEKAVTSTVAATEISGFRKGKAPRDLVEPKLDKTKLYSQAIQEILPNIYSQAVKTQNLKPILQPEISLLKGDEGQDWQFLAVLCEAPIVKLPPDFKAEITRLTKEPKESRLTRILEYLVKSTEVKIPDLLIVEESNHRLSALVENITKLGLTTQSYLQAKKLTPETLKANMAQEARTDLALEFILNQVRTEEKLPDRQKTLDLLQSLI